MPTLRRKADHLRINTEYEPSSSIRSGFDKYRFVHNALPEIDLEKISIEMHFLGKQLAAPVLISCMTGGTHRAGDINRVLARTAQRFGFAVGIGSGRALLEDMSLLPSFDVRNEAPDALLLANLGAVQLNRGIGVRDCRRLVNLLRADALILHLNALQEALQPEGDTVFSGLLPKIAEVCRALDVPVVVKEVGWGIAPDEARRLLDCGVTAIDVAGAGGTSWSEVERHRATGAYALAARQFRGWGIPTARCIIDTRRALPQATIIASGGIVDGIDIAKAIALGANLAGIARPFLLAADDGEESAAEFARGLLLALRASMFALGITTIEELRGTKRLVNDEGHMKEQPPNGCNDKISEFDEEHSRVCNPNPADKVRN